MNGEQEELEALGRWWKENGRGVVAGLVIGIGAVVGWSWWRSHVAAQAERASVRYEQLVDQAAAGHREVALAEAKSLVEEFPDSGYAPLAALVAARAAIDAGKPDEAKKQLRWVVAHPVYPELADVARTRLARLLLSEHDYDGALAAARAVGHGDLTVVASELEGDALLGKSDRAGARAAYERALAAASISHNARVRIQMKLDDLGHVTQSAAAG